MKKKNVVWEVVKFVLIFLILTFVWMFVFAACSDVPEGVDYEPFPGAFALFGLATTVLISMLANYNYLQSGKQAVDAAYHNVNVQIEKRDSLIGRANDLVGSYLKHEENVFTSRTQLDYSNIALLVESYPELKTNHSVMELLRQIDTCENAIAFRKEAYNKLVNEFNSAIHAFPVSVLAGLCKCRDALYYQDREKSNEMKEA